jgi:ABC-type multidrug transport system permease subunit
MLPNSSKSNINAVNNAVPKGPELNIVNAKSIDGSGAEYAKKNRDYRKSQEDRIDKMENTVLNKVLSYLPLFVAVAFIFMLIWGFMSGFKKHW